MTPERIQRKRTKGWRMPANTVYVGRGSKWGNPYKVGDNQWTPQGFKLWSSYADVVDAYRQDVADGAIDTAAIRADLAGKNLSCWCPLDQHCHADVLLEIANTTEELREGKPVLYWPGVRSDRHEPQQGIVISNGVVVFGGTACVRIRKQDGGTDYIQLSHVDAAS